MVHLRCYDDFLIRMPRSHIVYKYSEAVATPKRVDREVTRPARRAPRRGRPERLDFLFVGRGASQSRPFSRFLSRADLVDSDGVGVGDLQLWLHSYFRQVEERAGFSRVWEVFDQVVGCPARI